MIEITSARNNFKKRIVCDTCRKEITDISYANVVWSELLAEGVNLTDYKFVHKDICCDPRDPYVYWEPLEVFLDGLNELLVKV